MKSTILFLLPIFLFKISVLSQPISESFELRYFSSNPKANGETDFKGKTEFFDTEKRIEYLENYEKVAGDFFGNKDWDQLVISDEEAKAIAKNIKPQPIPVVRKRIILDEWKMLGSKPGKREAEQAQLDWWNQQKGVIVENKQLHFTEKQAVTKDIEVQDWRSLIKLDLKPAPSDKEILLSLGDALKLHFKSGDLLVNIQGKNSSVARYTAGNFMHLEIETDLESGKYNLYVNEQKVVDFLPLDNIKPFDAISVSAGKGTFIDNLYGVKYTKIIPTDNKNSRDIPFLINTFLDEKFSLTPQIHGWQAGSYNDEQWAEIELPYAHGGDRYKNESMYLRKNVYVNDYDIADLNIEALDPGGEIWVNGEVIMLIQKRTPVKIDISGYLNKNSENTIAIRVFPNKVEHTNRHTSSDLYTGWFAGRSWLDLHKMQYINDVFVYTKDLDKDATVSVNVQMKNDEWGIEQREIKVDQEFDGFLKIQFYKWFPEESALPAYEGRFPINLRLKRDFSFSQDIVLESPDKWHFNDPNLYKIIATIEDVDGKAIDDYVITTGIREISQEGGTFRINGQPEMMNGALLFAYKYPLEDIARTVRCGDDYWLVKEIMMMKRGNGNTLRMSVHHGSKGGINDPRLAEIGDQLGIMFQWTTGTWVRSGTPWIIDFEALPEYVKQVRNHPSIVMWQPGNHPKFQDFSEEGAAWMKKVYTGIYANDPSRLISATANMSRFGDEGTPNDLGTLIGKGEVYAADPVWTAPMLTRGNMDHTTGYGADWVTLREYPVPPLFISDMGWREKGYRMDYLNSKDRAYFDYESEESVGQPNWNLRKGKPSYLVQSYEFGYAKGSIGRILTPDEWRISQAWQGFSAFEAYKKKRWLDYDGMAWCTLHGGGNTSTYQKPLIDYFGYSKIVFHTVKMSFQDVLACSKNVDVVYGPEDEIEPVIMNLGNTKKVNLLVTVKDLDGNAVEQKEYRNIILNEGRTSTDLGNFRSKVQEGYFFIHYQIIRNE